MRGGSCSVAIGHLGCAMWLQLVVNGPRAGDRCDPWLEPTSSSDRRIGCSEEATRSVALCKTDRYEPDRTDLADHARTTFEGMPGLRFKFFTLDEKLQRARNFYVWESKEAAEGVVCAICSKGCRTSKARTGPRTAGASSSNRSSRDTGS